MDEMFDLAVKDGVKVLGINDFYSTEGYTEFGKLAYDKKIYPMYNVEFVSLDSTLQESKICINDPLNYGVIYIVGKGFMPNKSLSNIREDHAKILKEIRESQTIRIRQMIDSVNSLFNSDLLRYDEVLKNTVKDFVGERHVAKEIKRVYSKIGMSESDIRSKLLKRGGEAYIEETENSFLKTDKCIEIIKSAGGIPCYPVLLDHNNQLTQYESNLEELHKNLLDLDIKHLDVIPDRNSPEEVYRLVDFFDKRGFYILFGTEHNTDQMKSLRVTHKGGGNLNSHLVNIAYKGCCSVAAWQNGYPVDSIKIGDEAIKSYI